jgi:hypothetical protein
MLRYSSAIPLHLRLLSLNSECLSTLPITQEQRHTKDDYT